MTLLLFPLLSTSFPTLSNQDIFMHLLTDSRTHIDYYKFIFFPRTIIHQNVLPAHIPVLPTLAQFRYASSLEFDPHVRHILSWRLGHENISTAILPLPLIQEEQLSVTGMRMCMH